MDRLILERNLISKHLYFWKILVSAVFAFAVNFLVASQDVDFKWYATWNVFLGPAFGVDFVVAATAVADFLVIVLFLWRGHCASWLGVAVALSMWLFVDGAAGVGSIAAVVDLCARADVLDIVGVVVKVSIIGLV